MFGVLAGVVGLTVAAAAILTVLFAGSVEHPVEVPVDHPGLRRLRRIGLASRGVGLVLGLLMLIVLGRLDRLGNALVLIPGTFAAVQLAGVVVAEVMTRRDARQPGTAGLEVRRVRDYLPPKLTTAVVVAGLSLAGVMAYTTVVAGADDLGRPGRALTYACPSPERCDFTTFSPWPGSSYTVPLTVGLGVVIALAALALSVAVGRPRNGAEPDVLAIDEVIRRQSVTSTVAAALFALAGSLAGLGLGAGFGLLGAAEGGPAAFLPIGLGLLLAGFCGLAGLSWAIVVLLRPLLRPSTVPDRRPASVGPGRGGVGRS